MIVWAQRFSDLRILHDATDLFADQIGDDLVAVDVDALVGPELGQDVDEIAGSPCRFEPFAALGVAQLPAHHRLLRPWHAGHRPARLLAIGGAVAFERREAIGRRRAIVGGKGEIRRALEHGQLRGLLRNHRNRLDAGRPRADHGDASA